LRRDKPKSLFASNLRDALPNASFIGFTGTPVEKTDANTRAVFGDYISIYGIQRAVAGSGGVDALLRGAASGAGFHPAGNRFQVCHRSAG
jgi:hypothetical protein